MNQKQERQLDKIQKEIFSDSVKLKQLHDYSLDKVVISSATKLVSQGVPKEQIAKILVETLATTEERTEETGISKDRISKVLQSYKW